MFGVLQQSDCLEERLTSLHAMMTSPEKFVYSFWSKRLKPWPEYNNTSLLLRGKQVVESKSSDLIVGGNLHPTPGHDTWRTTVLNTILHLQTLMRKMEEWIESIWQYWMVWEQYFARLDLDRDSRQKQLPILLILTIELPAALWYRYQTIYGKITRLKSIGSNHLTAKCLTAIITIPANFEHDTAKSGSWDTSRAHTTTKHGIL